MEGDLGWCHGGSSNNWDLHAVVRFACGGAPPSPPTDGAFSWPSPPPFLADAAAVDDLCEALLAAPEPEAPCPSSSPRNEAPTTQQPTASDDAPAAAKPRPSGRGSAGPTRSKRKSKKSQVRKEVTRVSAGAASADPWAWRKYGQKPIKGSPYPRGYYRCSTDKECRARKQVERCRADPATLIVTYTGEHSHPVPLHRNSLAGTTRSKPQPPLSAEEPPRQQAQSPPPSESSAGGLSSPPSACAGLSPATPLRSPSAGVEYEDEEEDDTVAVRMLLDDADMAVEDDALLFLQPDDEPVPAAGTGSNGAGACDDDMLFTKPGEPQPATVSACLTSAGTTAPTMNLVDERFSVSDLSAWQAAPATGWGL